MWTMKRRSEMARDSNRLTQAMPWISEIEHAKNSSVLATSNSITRIATGDFDTLASKIDSGLMNILLGYFRKRVFNDTKKQPMILTWRQVGWVI